MREARDELAELLRIAYHKHEGMIGRLEVHPWESLSDKRKEKWLVMADTAIEWSVAMAAAEKEWFAGLEEEK